MVAKPCWTSRTITRTTSSCGGAWATCHDSTMAKMKPNIPSVTTETIALSASGASREISISTRSCRIRTSGLSSTPWSLADRPLDESVDVRVVDHQPDERAGAQLHRRRGVERLAGCQPCDERTLHLLRALQRSASGEAGLVAELGIDAGLLTPACAAMFSTDTPDPWIRMAAMVSSSRR